MSGQALYEHFVPAEDRIPFDQLPDKDQVYWHVQAMKAFNEMTINATQDNT